jgi:hypothetical protein
MATIYPRNELFDHGEFFQPAQEQMRRGMGLFSILGPLHCVQHFVTLVDPWARLVLARKRYGVIEIPDDPAIDKPQLGGKIKLDRHSRLNNI